MSIKLEFKEVGKNEVEENEVEVKVEENSEEDEYHTFDIYSFFDEIFRGYFFLIITLFIILSFIILVIISIVYDAGGNKENSAENNITFWGNLFLKYFVIILLQFITSYFVKNKNLKVNYSRKIMHFSFFLWPQLLDNIILEFDDNIITQFWNVWIILFTIYLLIEKIRKAIPICDYMFAAIDRPEDRPFTAQWTFIQIFLIFIVLIPFNIFFIKDSNIPSEWIFIPILINGFSDGLAEPIGIRFGKHKYKTFALCTNKRYERSFEGSLWVYISSLAIVAIFHDTFNQNQLIVGLIVYPILITFVEGVSPHTIDAPFLYLFGYIGLLGIKYI